MRQVGDGDESYDFQVAVAPYIVFGLMGAMSLVGLLSYLGYVH